jgi:hypothetical protein
MHRSQSAVLLLLIGGLLFVASGQAPAKERGVLSVLHAGQAVNLQDSGNGYEISFLKNGPETLGHRVVEVFSDCVVIEDIAGVNQTRIPIYSVKSVVVTKRGAAK